MSSHQTDRMPGWTGGVGAQTSAVFATLASPVFTGDPTAPTPTVGDNDTSIATTAFVTAAVAAGGGSTSAVSSSPVSQFAVSKFLVVGTAGAGQVRARSASNLANALDIVGITSAAAGAGAAVNVVSQGRLSGTTAEWDAVVRDAAGVLVTGGLVASTVYYSHPVSQGSLQNSQPTDQQHQVRVGVALSSTVMEVNFGLVSYAPVLNPTFTGAPAAPTAAAGTNTTQLATTAFVATAVSVGGITRNRAGAMNAAIVTVTSADTLLVSLDVGTVSVGDEIRVDTTLSPTKGATAGGVSTTCYNATGTAVLESYNNDNAIVDYRYLAASGGVRFCYSGSFRVTTAGTCVLRLSASSAGSSSTVGAGEAQITARVLKGP